MALDSMSGSVPQFTVLEQAGGLVLRRKAVFRRALSDRQKEAAWRLRAAAEIWQGFGRAQGQAWEHYARTLVRRHRFSGQEYTPTAFAAFTALATKVLQIDPEAPVPTWPPEAPFEGDGLVVSVEAILGGLEFMADRPDAPGVTTEILVQRLRNARAKPVPVYPSQGFVVFAPGTMRWELALRPGWYSAAVRSVLAMTGQTTRLVPIGEREVVA